MATRKGFSLQDKDRLARFLVQFPEHQRTSLTIYKTAGAQLPGHPYQSWHEHYRKTAKFDIDCRIERIKRHRAKEEQRTRNSARPADDARTASGKQDNDEDDDEEQDQLESDSGSGTDNMGVPARNPVASTSKARLSDAEPNPKPRTSTSSFSRVSLPSSDDHGDDHHQQQESSSGSDSDIEVHRRKPTKPAGRRSEFTDRDFDLCVAMMADQQRSGYTKKELCLRLERKCPDHTFSSWQSWMTKNQRSLDKAVRKHHKQEKEECDRRREEKQQKKKRRRASAKTGGGKAENDPVDAADADESSRRETPIAGPSRPRASDGHQAPPLPPTTTNKGAAAFAKAVVAAVPNRSRSVSVSGAGVGSGSGSGSGTGAFPRPRVDKGKGRALSPRRLPSSPPASATAAEETFTEEDTHQLVHQLARARIKQWEPDNVFVFLGDRFPQHSRESWRAFWHENVFELVPRVAARVDRIKQSQAAKQQRQSGVAPAERDQQRGGAVDVVQVVSAPAEGPEEEDEGGAGEVAEQVARDAEERYRREEDEQEEAEKEKKRRRLSSRREDAAAAVTTEAATGPSVDDHLFDAPSPSPPPGSRTTRSRVPATATATTAALIRTRDAGSVSAGTATPVKPADVGAGLAAAVLTPRHTPPHAAAEQEDGVPASGEFGGEQPGTGDANAETDAAALQQPQQRVEMVPPFAAGKIAAGATSGDALPSSQSTLPHHSQYSQMPSPFVRDFTRDMDDAADGFGPHGALSGVVDAFPKVEEESDEDLELLVSPADPIKIPIDDDVGEEGAPGGENWHLWNELAPAEHRVIQDLHAAVADIQQIFRQGSPRRRVDSTAPAPQVPVAGPVSAPAPVPLSVQPQSQQQPQPRRVTARKPATPPSVAGTSLPSRPVTVIHDLPPAPASGGAASAQAAYVLNSPPPKKRQRERSPSSDDAENAERVGSRHAPSPKRQKLNPLPRQAAAAAAARPRHSAPAGLRKLQQDSPAPTPGRRVPRASLAATLQASSASPAPAPPPAAEQALQPSRTGQQPLVASPASRAAENDTLGQPYANAKQQSVSTSAPRSTTDGLAAGTARAEKPGGLKLKDLIAALARKYGVSERAITNLVFCMCAKCDQATLEDAIRWFVPAHRPLAGTPEHERLARLVAKHVWTLREDTIALEGSEAAVAQLEAKRGRHAIQRRVAFLGRAHIKNVASLRKDLYTF